MLTSQLSLAPLLDQFCLESSDLVLLHDELDLHGTAGIARYIGGADQKAPVPTIVLGLGVGHMRF